LIKVTRNRLIYSVIDYLRIRCPNFVDGNRLHFDGNQLQYVFLHQINCGDG